MKGFIASICIMAIILGLVIANSIFTLNTTNDLIEKIRLLNSDSYILMEEILELWDEKSPILCLSSSTKETDKIDDMLSAIESMFNSNNFLGLEEKKSLLINYIKLINTHERVSIENIL